MENLDRLKVVLVKRAGLANGLLVNLASQTVLQVNGVAIAYNQTCKLWCIIGLVN